MLAVLYAAGFMAAYNENIINVILVDVMSTFSVSTSTAQWLVTGYMIVTAVVVSITAFLFRRFAIKQLVCAGSLFLIVGAVGCFLAANFPMLLVFRLLQAFGTGIFIPLMMTTVLMVAPKQRLGTFMSIGSCCITFGPALAPVLSGLLATLLGWRFVFVLPAVVVVVIMVLSFALVKNIGEPSRVKLDVPSIVLSALGLTALVFGLNELASALVVALVALAVGCVLIGLFVARQRVLDEPILDLRPLSQRSFLFGSVLAIFAMMTTFSMSVVLVLYYEGALGMTALAAGALLLPPILLNALTALIGGRVMDKRGAWPLIPLGFLVIVVGQASIAYTSYDAALLAVGIGSCVTYAGVGLVFAPAQTAALNTVPHDQNASGVSIMNLFIQVAASLGPALFTGVLSSTAASEAALGVGATLAQAHGFSAALWVATGVAALGVVIGVVFARSSRGEASRSAASTPAAALSLGEVMKTDVHAISDKASVADLVSLLIETHTGSVPVVDGRRHVVGFVSDGDVVRYMTGDEAHADMGSSYALMQAMAAGDAPRRYDEVLGLNVMDLAVRQVVSVDSHARFEDVCRVLSNKRVKKVPVLDGGCLVGTVSRSDLLRAFLQKQLADAQPESAQ